MAFFVGKTLKMNTSNFRNHCCSIFCTIVILLIILVKTLISVNTVWLYLIIRFFRVMPFSPFLRRFSSRLLAAPFPIYYTLNFFVTLHKKWGFYLSFTLVNVNKSAENPHIFPYLIKKSLTDNFVFCAL